MSLSCSFWGEPAPRLEWSWGGLRLGNTSATRVRHYGEGEILL